MNPEGDDEDEDLKDANTLLAGGVGVAAIGLAGALIGGAACPLCVVVAPTLLGLGAVRRLRAGKGKRQPRGAR